MHNPPFSLVRGTALVAAPGFHSAGQRGDLPPPAPIAARKSPKPATGTIHGAPPHHRGIGPPAFASPLLQPHVPAGNAQRFAAPLQRASLAGAPTGAAPPASTRPPLPPPDHSARARDRKAAPDPIAAPLARLRAQLPAPGIDPSRARATKTDPQPFRLPGLNRELIARKKELGYPLRYIGHFWPDPGVPEIDIGPIMAFHDRSNAVELYFRARPHGQMLAVRGTPPVLVFRHDDFRNSKVERARLHRVLDPHLTRLLARVRTPLQRGSANPLPSASPRPAARCHASASAPSVQNDDHELEVPTHSDPEPRDASASAPSMLVAERQTALPIHLEPNRPGTNAAPTSAHNAGRPTCLTARAKPQDPGTGAATPLGDSVLHVLARNIGRPLPPQPGMHEFEFERLRKATTALMRSPLTPAPDYRNACGQTPRDILAARLDFSGGLTRRAALLAVFDHECRITRKPEGFIGVLGLLV